MTFLKIKSPRIPSSDFTLLFSLIKSLTISEQVSFDKSLLTFMRHKCLWVTKNFSIWRFAGGNLCCFSPAQERSSSQSHCCWSRCCCCRSCWRTAAGEQENKLNQQFKQQCLSLHFWQKSWTGFFSWKGCFRREHVSFCIVISWAYDTGENKCLARIPFLSCVNLILMWRFIFFTRRISACTLNRMYTVS